MSKLKTSIILFSILLLIFIIGWFLFPTISIVLGLLLVVVSSVIFALLWNKNMEIGLLLFTASLFFERLPTLEVCGFSLKLSFIFGIGLILVWMIGVIKSKFQILNSQFSIPNSKLIFIPLIVFWIINLISLLINPIEFRNLAIFLLISFNILLFFVVSFINIKEEMFVKISNILIIGSLVVCLLALYQYVGNLTGLNYKWTFLREHYTKRVFGFPRVHSTFLEPLLFANFLLIPMFLLVSEWLKERFSNKFFIFSAITFLTVIIITVARSAYVAVAGAALITLVLAYKDVFKWKKVLIIICVIAVSAGIAFSLIRFGGGSTAATNFVEHSQTLVKKGNKGVSADDRLNTFKQSLNAFKEKPIFGIGPGGFGKYYKEHAPIDTNEGTQTVNNEYLEILAENGALGAAAFAIFIISLLVFALKKYYQTKDCKLLGLITATFAVLIQYNFYSSLYVIYIWFLWALLLNQTEKRLGTKV